MEKVLNIYQRMNSVMKEVEYIQKREKKDGMRFNFVSHDDVSAKLHQPLAKHGIQPVPTVLDYKIEDTKHTLRLSLSFVNIDNPDDKITVEGWGYSLDAQDKGYGKAMSYAMKYIFLKTFVLESGDEDEVDAYQDEEPKKAASKPVYTGPRAPDDKVTPAQLDLIKKLVNGSKDKLDKVLKDENVTALELILKNRATAVIDSLKQKGAA